MKPQTTKRKARYEVTATSGVVEFSNKNAAVYFATEKNSTVQIYDKNGNFKKTIYP
jgi:hypothetical protein